MLITSPAATKPDTLYEDPLIQQYENFLCDKEASQLLSAGRDKLRRAEVSSDKGGVQSAGRTGSNCWIPHNQDKVILRLATRIAALVGLPLAQAESFQMVHYAESQEYRPHYDAWEHDTERGQRCMARGGQRLLTCLLYLNDVPAGGSTAFPRLNLEVEARKGRLLIFHNCHSGSNQRHADSLHGGLPVIEGEKWACNLWFRERDRSV